MQGVHCRACGQYHPGLPLSYGAHAPASWYEIPEVERETRTLLSSDQCIVDDRYFFVLGNIEIPILESDEVFTWSVWVSLSESNFERASELWNTPGRESEPPYFGWLNTSLPGYSETINLKTMMYTRPVGRRPFIDVEPTEHPLAVEQHTGISWERIHEIAEIVFHQHPDGGSGHSG